MERWAGKVVLVTGASAGIGAAVVKELFKYDLKIVGLARRPELIEAKKSELQGPGQLYAIKADVTKEEEIIRAFNWIKEKFGTIHVLVNCAGVYRGGKLSQQDSKYLRQVLDTNVMGLTLCAQQAIKLMRETGVNDGHIILMSSIAAHAVLEVNGEPVFAMYTASKYAIRAITETLRQELRFFKTKIKISSVSGGYADTDIVATGDKVMNIPPDPNAGSLDDMPLLQPKDIADAIIYILGTPPHVQILDMIIKPVGEMV